MLTASAGYDPRIAPEVYKKLGSVSGNNKPSSDPHSTHPFGEERAQLLSQDMEKALSIYKKKVKAGDSIQGQKEGGIDHLILTPKGQCA
ncbi:hypothetical protein FRX31_022854 [Thalictrum thalictroides]|uniref:Uncharacterized protein n=1 Tax=Thalictrum thalictroides TaxID=46969 RepID=A0A7J6VT66_THATH|nr:hypothetical protein FRX31_022854 [Thalictrum thalictroides]